MWGDREQHCISAGGRFTGLNLALPQLPGSFPLTPTAGNSMAQGGCMGRMALAVILRADLLLGRIIAMHVSKSPLSG